MPVFVNFFSLRALRVSFGSSAGSTSRASTSGWFAQASATISCHVSQGAVCGFWSHFQTYPQE